MENHSIQFEELIKRIEEYADTNIKLLKYKAIDKMSALVSSVITYRIIIAGFTVFFLFLSLAVALWLGEVFGKIYYGVFIICGFYGIIALVLYGVRDRIRQQICNSIISKAFN